MELEHLKIETRLTIDKFFVYYESMKRKLEIKPIYECRCNGRLQTKRFTRLSHTGPEVGRGTGTPKDKDEVNKREVCDCEG
jgi:hypothetical protein